MGTETNPLLSGLPETAFTGVTTFAPKLSMEDRCSILALSLSGINKHLLARAFGIDRRTVSHIVNTSSPKYKGVMDEYRRLGHKEFCAKYITENAALKVKAAAEEKAEPVEKPKISRSASSHSGIHILHPEQCAYSHRVEVRYFDGSEEGVSMRGWHYRDLDSKSTPDMWLHNGEESLQTSANCVRMAELNLTDD